MNHMHIRTKDGIYKSKRKCVEKDCLVIGEKENGKLGLIRKDIIKQADTIEELCDWFLTIVNGRIHTYSVDFEYAKAHLFLFEKCESVEIKGAIETDKGLIYVARMKGILPNGEIDWELL